MLESPDESHNLGRARDTCVTIAEGYEELAEIIEAQRPESRPD